MRALRTSPVATARAPRAVLEAGRFCLRHLRTPCPCGRRPPRVHRIRVPVRPLVPTRTRSAEDFPSADLSHAGTPRPVSRAWANDAGRVPVRHMRAPVLFVMTVCLKVRQAVVAWRRRWFRSRVPIARRWPDCMSEGSWEPGGLNDVLHHTNISVPPEDPPVR
jgi:hypothetical protein